MNVRRPRRSVAVAALFAGILGFQAAAQESRRTVRGLNDDPTASVDVVVARTNSAKVPRPRFVPRDVRVHVLDAQGRPWRPTASDGAVVRYKPDELFGPPIGLGAAWQVPDDRSALPLDADGVTVVRVESEIETDLCLVDGEVGGRLYFEASDLASSGAFALCLSPLRTLRLRGRTDGGDPIPLGRLSEAKDESGVVILARRDRLVAGDFGLLENESDEAAAERIWTRGLVCPDVPVTIRTEFLGRTVTFDVPASCDVFETRLAGLGAVDFLTASHRRWMLVRPAIARSRELRSTHGDALERRQPAACWLDREPIKDGCVGRRRAVMWPGRYRIGLAKEEPVEFEVRSGEAVEVPLP